MNFYSLAFKSYSPSVLSSIDCTEKKILPTVRKGYPKSCMIQLNPKSVSSLILLMCILDTIHIAAQCVSHDELFEGSDLVSSNKLLYKLNLMVSYTVISKSFYKSFLKRTFLVYISNTDSCIG